MNVLLISREFPPFFGGGIGTYTRQHAGALARAGHRPVVVTVSDDGREQREGRGGVTIVRLPFLSGDDWTGPHPSIATPEAAAAFRTFAAESVFAMQVGGALPRLIEEFAIDVVEAPDTGALAWFGLNARRTGAAWGVGSPPLVTVVHSPTKWVSELNHEPTGHRRRAELILMERESARWSDGLVCPSAGLAEWAQREWGTAATVVPYPLGDLEASARGAADRGPVPGSMTAGRASPRRLVFVGRLEPRKGVDTLLRGFAQAVARGADLVLDLVGRDVTDARSGRAFGSALLEATPASARSRITVHGRVPSERVLELVGGAAAAVVPSPTDNYPYACIEAMASGRAVIAARAGGMAELVRDGIDGLLFEPGSAAALGESLERIAGGSARELQELGRAAAARVLDVCGNERVAGARIAHYEAVIGRARGQRSVASDAGLVWVNAGALEPGVEERLACAARMPGIEFAHGWPRLADGTVLPFGTPCVESLAKSPRRMGPLAVRRAALGDERVRSRLAVAGPDAGRARVASTWELAFALCEAGHRGAVVPECVITLGGGSAGAPSVRGGSTGR